ncbi:hypothetical protein PHYPO_G00095290 [Pangasianodon hypophthalmus]|uniref:Dynein heavy chain tail domain-containing protein n=1 Tax=Pangasianodon hypophthalmus TaxID=310915 RepID=A0A5N5LB09_PANHP|nr:hypothetical protein PHYPO_G00095290 [Pangasianodon hypophthalmus]
MSSSIEPTVDLTRCSTSSVPSLQESLTEKMAKFKEARESRQSLLKAAHRYIIEVLAAVLCLDDAVVEEFVLDAPSLAPFDDFFVKGGERTIAFVYQESEVPGIECGRTFPGTEEGAKIMRLFLANLKETTLFGLCLFFMRNNVNVAINSETIHQEISFSMLDASEGVLMGQRDLLSKVYLPAICATEDWGILTNTEDEEKIKQNFKNAILNYINFLDEAQMMMESVQLSEASGIDFSRLMTADDMKAAGEDVSMMRKCEKVLMMWCKEIDQVLTDSDQIRKEDEASGILTELKHWKKISAKLRSITEEIKGTEFKTVLNFLLVNQSKKLMIWRDLDTRLTDYLNEAKDTVKLLSMLEKNCQPLYSFDPVTMAKSIQLITDSIFMMQYVSRYCSTSQHITLLFIKVTNLMLTGCSAYITDNGSSQIWDQDTETIIKKIQGCMYLFREYQSCFRKTKELILEQKPAGKPIEVSEKPILGKFERFCKRLKKISQMMTAVKTFSLLSHSKIEGIDFLAAKFQNIYINMKTKQDNMLDHGNKEFEVEFAEFTSQINNLVLQLEDFMSSSISKIQSCHHALNLLQRFQKLNMPWLQAEISKNYSLILNRFVSELEHVKEHYQSNREDPPLGRNIPPVAGRILWVRNLFNKIQEPIRNFEKYSDILSTPEGKEVVQMYNKTAALFVEFEILHHKAWMKEVSELKDTLQVAHPKMQELFVNFEAKIHKIIRETKLMQKMGMEVSEQALYFTSKATHLKAT